MPCLDETRGAELIRYGLGQLDAAERKAVEAHLWDCLHCRVKWYELAPYFEDLRHHQQEFSQQLRAGLVENEEAARPKQADSTTPIPHGFLASRKKWPLAATVVLTAGLTSVLFFFLKVEKPSLHEPSPGERSVIRLLDPASSEMLRWERTLGAQYYRVTIREEATGAVILEQQTTEAVLIFSESLKRRMEASKSYNWTIEAFDKENRSIGGPTQGYLKRAVKPN